MAKKPAVGDTITVLSTVGKYKEDVQLKNAVIVNLAVVETVEPDAAE